MSTHPLLRRARRVTVLLGIAVGTGLGVALAASPVAGADAIDDAWPYLSMTSTPYPVATFPGAIASLPTTSNGDIATYVHHLWANDEWYTAHATNTYITLLGSVGHSEITAILDGSTFPHVGATEDDVSLFPFTPVQIGLSGYQPMFINSYLNDPTIGFADTFTMQGYFGNGVGITNTYISDAAGIKDTLSFEGQPPFLTLFEFPATDPASAASDLSQLMTDFTGLF
ncbi:hypothetical protein [Mycolicibacter kumamotonensis]|uniref:hypothetical protein n=1 Tax=Mycolicibacter kumamotonensis TaxID=354243 RepID=UPI000A576C6D|nr:hypothetical protein [Mycolicibacter kumamotonensis]